MFDAGLEPFAGGTRSQGSAERTEDRAVVLGLAPKQPHSTLRGRRQLLNFIQQLPIAGNGDSVHELLLEQWCAEVTLDQIGQYHDERLALELLFMGQPQRNRHRRATGDAAQDAFFASQPARSLHGLLVADSLHAVDHREVQRVRNEARPQALDFGRTGPQRLLFQRLRDDRAARRLHAYRYDLLPLRLLDISRNAGDGPPGADAGHQIKVRRPGGAWIRKLLERVAGAWQPVEEDLPAGNAGGFSVVNDVHTQREERPPGRCDEPPATLVRRRGAGADFLSIEHEGGAKETVVGELGTIPPGTIEIPVWRLRVGGEPLLFIGVLLLKIRVLMDFAGPIGARELAVLICQGAQDRKST